MALVENVASVAQTLYEQAVFVHEKMDWEAYRQQVVRSEVLYFSIFFLVGKLVLFRIPEEARKAYLNPFLKLYNFGMVIYSFGTFLAMVKALQEVPLYTNDCEAAFKNDLFNLASKLFYYSKFVEYIDSFSLVLAGKPVTFLQSFHHLGAPIDMYVFYSAQNEGIWIMVLLNSFIHTIMYFYYLMALLKIRFPGKFMITVMQIAQFNLGFYLVWWYKEVPCFANSPVHMFGWLYNYFYVGLVLVLFVNFSIWTYVFPKQAKKKVE
eukprot:TRINITY_DN72955_c0_g1_i1.p1 TRINITY_DN72955_c0_g1~~TRINITY_DN72955_c0_g1_i1.p1  ORF type:complete len:287 (+),score=147.15 TRINITY_DN72955_c0_g1_i1:67-861(+)